MRVDEHLELPESLRKTIQLTEGLTDPIAPIIEEQQHLRDSMAPMVQQVDEMKALVTPIVQEKLPVIQNPMADVLETVKENSIASGFGELAMGSALSDYPLRSAVLFEGVTAAVDYANKANDVMVNIAKSLTTLINSDAMRKAQEITSSLGKWLQGINFSPLLEILQNIRDFDFEHDYDDVNEVFLKAMFDARWFPYAGWSADFTIVREMLEILETSRESKNRTKRIDKLIFSYYDKEALDDLKRKWRKRNLPSYMTRILIQSVQAYNRREYALTVSTLCTLWEGIICEKVNDTSYRISKKTRENLTNLISENAFDRIFASFCEEFIFYDCRKPEDVKPDVPGRHGIAHCWYSEYPNRKMALNAIIFTNFLLALKPLEKTEETDEKSA